MGFARDNRPTSAATSERAFRRIQSQVRPTRRRVRTVARKTLIRQDWQNLSRKANRLLLGRGRRHRHHPNPGKVGNKKSNLQSATNWHLRMLPLSQVSCIAETELVEYAERKPKARSCKTRSVILNLVEIPGRDSQPRLSIGNNSLFIARHNFVWDILQSVSGGLNGVVGILYELVVTQAVLSLDGEAKYFDRGGFGEIEFEGHLLTKNAEVISQYFDTDITIAADEDLTIIQCKASERREPMTHGDLVQILLEGANHLKKIRDSGDSRKVSKFIIATNRPISHKIQNLNNELRKFREEKGTGGTKCPSVLLETAGQKMSPKRLVGKPTVLEWASAIKISRKDDEGKAIKSPIDPSLAPCIVEIVQSLHYALIRAEEVQKRFADSLRRYGLNEAEIDRAGIALKGELLEASKEGRNVVTALRRQFSSDDKRSLSLCPDRLRPIEEQLVQHQWDRSDQGQTIAEVEINGLPRENLVHELIRDLQLVVDAPQERGLVLIGDGGIGKTQLLFEVPKLVRHHKIGGSEDHLFAFADCRPKFENPVGRALLPFFDSHKYVQGQTDGSALLARLRSAFDACGTKTKLWILLPDADELGPSELMDLLDSITESVKSEPIFVLTARQDPWDNSGGPHNLKFLRPLAVGKLDPNEIYSWLSDQGVSTQGFSRSVAPMRNVSSVVQQRSPVAIDAGILFGHPLSFRALQIWLNTRKEVKQRQADLQHLLQGHENLMSDFMLFLRDTYVDRVYKHSMRFGVKRDAIEELFQILWAMRDELPNIPASAWATDLCPNLTQNQNPDLVIRQFAQSGVLKYADQQASRIQWAVPYQP